MNLADVIVIDDDAFVRSSLTAGLKAYGVNVVGTGQTFASAFEFCTSHKVDVAIVDLDLGQGPSGFDICQSLRRHFPGIGLILLTSYTNLQIADPNMPILPKGTRFLTKSNLNDFQILINEILSVKRKPLSSNKRISNKGTLTSTQIEVLRMLAEGLSTNEIATRRGVSSKAIEGMIAKIHHVLNLEKSKTLNQRVQLARAYFKLSGKSLPGEK
jgi:DNA-binding NarL/FixJ family response regulator